MPYLLQSFGMSGYSSSFEHWKLTSSWVSSYWNSVEHCHLFCQTIRIAILLIVSLLHLVSWNIIVKEHTVRFSTYVVQCHSFHNSWKLSSCDLISLHNPPNNDFKMAMPHRKAIRFQMDNEITLKESIRIWARTLSCVARIRMWARIDQVWSFYRASMLPFLFLHIHLHLMFAICYFKCGEYLWELKARTTSRKRYPKM